MRVTINDIAKVAKVSPSTVSRVIANNPKISLATREKVFKIMKEMNYHPNIIARSLANRSTKIIGALLPGMAEQAFQHPFFPEVLRGISSVAYKKGYHILLASMGDGEDEKESIRDSVDGGITEGVILLASKVNDIVISELDKGKIPFVVVGKPENELEMNWVDNNNVTIGYEVTRHLLGLGLRQIAFIGVSPQYIVTVDRLTGYKKALAESGIPIDNRLIVESKFNNDNGYDLMKQLWARNLPISAVFACDDFLAFGVIRYLQEMGRRIPDDIAVAGINNVPLSQFSHPPLTTVEINAFTLGAKAFELLLGAVQSEVQSYNRAIVPAQLVIRESTSKKMEK